MNQDQFVKELHAAVRDFAGEKPTLKLGEDLGACERSVCFRIGLHLAKRVEPEYIVDSEYNLDLSADDRKSLPNTGKTGRVFPDFIVHKRTPDQADNFAVIEVKFLGDDAGIADAKVRIAKFQEKYGYKVGIVIAIPKSQENFLGKYKFI